MAEIDRDALRVLLNDLDVEFPEAVLETTESELRLRVDATQALELLGRLRDDPEISMRRLVDLTAIDWGESGAREGRFEIVYRLHAPNINQRIRVGLRVDGPDPEVDSVVAVWPAADWFEREVFDLFGIRFRGHPDLRRILLEAEFTGAPLRKDYPRQPNLARPKPVER